MEWRRPGLSSALKRTPIMSNNNWKTPRDDEAKDRVMRDHKGQEDRRPEN